MVVFTVVIALTSIPVKGMLVATTKPSEIFKVRLIKLFIFPLKAKS